MAAGLGGSVADTSSDCPSSKTFSYTEFDGTTRDALDAFGPEYNWQTREGRIHVLHGPNPELLKTRIRQFTFTPEKAVSLTIDDLLRLPEILTAIGKLSLHERPSEPGFAELPRRESQEARSMSDVSLEQALDVIAGEKRVWLYQEYKCGDLRMFAINWLVR